MQNFIVLGYIPGNNYQTGLAFWLIVTAVFTSILFLPQIFYAFEQLRRYLTVRQIARTINHLELITI